jgi:hypothetical protein
MIRKLFITGLAFLSFTFLNAQNAPILNRTCGTPPPSQEWNDWFNKEVEKFKANLQTGKSKLTNYTIPVVFHILHAGQAVGTYPNIDSNRIKAQIRVLNEDYGGIGYIAPGQPAGINTFSTLIANTNVQFCLAVKNPTGGILAERGIDRINSLTQFGTNPNTQTNIQTFINNTVKPATIWDPTKYFNVWISEQAPSGSLLGYATFPAGTTLPGITGGGGATNDGVWCVTNSVGSNAPGYAPGSNYAANYDLGRTLSHEAGHWLGLRHIWGDGNCLTDFCNDTPPATAANFGCPSSYPFHVNSCGAGLSPQGEMTQNIMDYSDDRCMFMFTPDQRTRIQTTMSQGSFRNLLGTHALCATTATSPPGPAVANFDIQNPCVGQPITPNNTSTGGPTPTFAWSASPNSVTFTPNANVASPAITFGSLTTYTLFLTATNTVNTSNYSYVVGPLTNCPKPSVCIDTLRMIKNTDTLTTYAASNNSLILGCQSGYSGFLTGTNCYKDKEFAQYYPSSTYSDTPVPQVNSVIVLFDSLGTKATASTLGTQIFCKVYGGTIGAGPNSLIASKGDSLGKIAASTNKTVTVKFCGSPTYTFTTTKIIPFKYSFNPPVQIPNTGFFCSVQTPYGSLADSIKIFSNTKTNLSNDSSSWVLQFSNNWRTLRYNKNAKVQLAILPQISCRAIVGIHENVTTFNSNITVMPNPSNGQLSLIFTLPKQENVTVRIFNPLGQQISADRIENVTNNMINIDLSNRPDGIYFIEVSNDTERVVKKVIISR